MSEVCITCKGAGFVRGFEGEDLMVFCHQCRPAVTPRQQQAAVREEGNVRILGGVTALDLPPERILNAAIGADLKLCIVVGEEQDGTFYFASNKASGPEVLWALEQAKLRLLKVGGAA